MQLPRVVTLTREIMVNSSYWKNAGHWLTMLFLCVQVWGHLAGGEWEEYLGNDPHSTGAPSEGAAGQDHPDHRLLAGQPAVALLRAQAQNVDGRPPEACRVGGA